MLRRITCFAMSVAAAALSGCSLFASRPLPLPRAPHVVLVRLDGLKPTDIHPARTPHLYRMLHDGAATWKLETRAATPEDVCREALTGSTQPGARSLFDRCRSAGLKAVTVQEAADPGAEAAREILRQRPELLFVELSAEGRKPEDCDAELGDLLAAVRRSGLADRTTTILFSAAAPRLWMIRGPETRHGRKLAAPVSAVDTFATAAQLLGLTPEHTLSKPVAEAFRSSRQPPLEGERTVPRGSVHGRVLRADGEPMARASVLLVKNETVDGISERWADTDALGEFRFDGIPAGTYDYVFVFDNLPCRLRRSLLVRMKFAVEPDAAVKPVLTYRRVRAPGRSTPPLPPARTAAAFLDDRELGTLVRRCRSGELAPPFLAADALSGRRVRTSLIREWLLASASRLADTLGKDPADAAVPPELADLAAAYDLNRASGLLTETEEQTVRTVLERAARQVLRRCYDGTLSGSAPAHVALGLAAAAFHPSETSSQRLRRTDRMFERHLQATRRAAEQDPTGIPRAELCSILEYALVNRATGCGNYIDDELERLVALAAACLTPADRRVHPDAHDADADRDLGFLGLARAAFAGRAAGSAAGALWAACGSPVWAPRGSGSVVGRLLTDAAGPDSEALRRAQSEPLTETTAVLAKDWGTPAECFVTVSGWDIDIHAGAARLARIQTRPTEGTAKYVPRISRFVSSPACDYVLLAGWVRDRAGRRLAAYRHVLFNKLTGYVAVADELPDGLGCSTELRASAVLPGGVLVGKRRMQAQLIGLGLAASVQKETVVLRSASPRPIFALYTPPPGVQAGAARIGPWDVTRAGMAEAGDPGGAHVVLQTDHGTEFLCLSRRAAHVEGNVEDNLLEGAVAVIRRGRTAVDLVLVNATWAQSGDFFFRLGRGTGYVTISDPPGASGWSDGPSRYASVILGENAPRHLTLTVDGRPESIRQRTGGADFHLSSGPRRFTLK